MKILLIALVTLSSLSVSAETLPAGVVYSRHGGQSEYPAAFKALENLVITGRKQPGPGEVRDQSCKVKAGTKIILAIHPNVVTQTYATGKFMAKKAFKHDVWNGEASVDIEIAQGEMVENVSYLAEGACQLRIKDVIHEGSCFYLTDEDANLEVKQELSTESWVMLKCAAGSAANTAWVRESQMESHKKMESFFYNPY